MTLPLLIFGACTGTFLAVIVGIIGSYRRLGFGWTFLISIIFTPLVGLICALISPRAAEEQNFGCLGAALVFIGVVIMCAITYVAALALGVISLAALTI